MVNVEAVYCRWTDNLPAFFKAADDKVNAVFGQNIAERMKDERAGARPGPRHAGGVRVKPPEGAGWVVEVRGYTYFDTEINGTEFINQSLVKNLQETDAFIEKVLKDENKVREYVPGVADPVKGKLTHVFPYLIQPARKPDGSFDFIDKTYLDPLVPAFGGGAAPADAAATAAAPGKAAPAAGGWVPLYGGPAPGAAAGTAAGAAAVSAAPPPAAAGGAKKTRYEFVIMFVWKEATPSEPAADAAAAPAGGR